MRANWYAERRETYEALETLSRACDLLAAVEPADCLVEVLIQIGFIVHHVYEAPDRAHPALEQCAHL